VVGHVAPPRGDGTPTEHARRTSTFHRSADIKSGQCAGVIVAPQPGHHRCDRLNNTNPATKPTNNAKLTATVMPTTPSYVSGP